MYININNKYKWIHEHDRHSCIDSWLRRWIYSNLRGNLWRSRRDNLMTRHTITPWSHSLPLFVRTTKSGRAHLSGKYVSNTRSTRYKQPVRETRLNLELSNMIRISRTSPNKIDLNPSIKEKISVVRRRYTVTSHEIS